MEILIASEKDKDRWDRFVEEQNGTIFHSFAWRKIIENSLKYKPYYFYAIEKNKIKAIVPFFFVKSFIFGKKFVTIGENAGPIGESNACKAILKKAIEIAEKLKLEQIEIHDAKEPYFEEMGFLKPFGHVSFLIDLERSQEELIMSFQKYLRKNIRRIEERKEVKVKEINSIEDIKIFYKIYQDNMHFLGTPPMPFSIYKEMFNTFYPDKLFGLIATCKGKDAGGIIMLLDGKVARCYLSMILSEFREENINTFLIWEAMRKCLNKAKVFDFGSSRPESGNYIFKQKWNPKEVERPIVYKLFKKDSTITDPRNKKFGRYVGIWKKIPKPICNLIGPYIRKSMGR